MTIAGSIPVYGNYTQTRFDNALPSIAASPKLAGEFSSTAPVAPAEFQAMQIKGRAWALPLRRLAEQTDTVAAPDKNPAPAAQRPPPVEDVAASALRRSISATDGDDRSAADAHLFSLLKSCADLSRKISEKGENHPEYAGALRAMAILKQSIILQRLRILQTGPTSRMEAEGGFIAVDVDEAAHGLYASIKNAFANGFGSLGETLARDSRLWAHDPKAWMTQSATPHGGADIAVAGVVTIALVPFALLAIQAGIREMRESKQQSEALVVEVAQSLEFLETLNRLSTSLHPSTPPQFRHLVESAQKVCTQQLEDLKQLQQKVKQNREIGFCSTTSGIAIAGNTALGFATKGLYLGLGGNAAATAMATTAGAASTMFFGPIAAVAAVGLGAKMVGKSIKAEEKFTPVAEQLKNRLADGALDALRRETAGKHDYLEFLPKKLDQRSRFFKDYAQKNKKFLGGSLVYAGGALTSFGLTLAALLGAGIVLGPIGMGALLFAGTVGGLIMARYSTQFLFGHERMLRYGNTTGDDFLASIETFTEKNPNIAKAAGMALRAACYKDAATRDELRQDFLGDVACDLGKPYRQALSHSTDSDEVRAKRGGAKSKWDILQATIQKKYATTVGYSRAGLNYFANLLLLRGHAAAKAAASKSWQEGKAYLNVNDLQDWLHDPANHARQIALMHDSLEAQIAFLREKSTLQVEMYMHGNSIDTAQLLRTDNDGAAAPNTLAASAAPLDEEAARAQNDLLRKLSAPLVLNAAMLGQAESLQAQLIRYRTDSAITATAPTASELAAITSRFLSLQRDMLYDPKEALPDIRQSLTSLANYYLKEASGQYRNVRGMLVETELRATRLANGN
ncbi:MAG TPA: hypothetical protein VGN04_10870 [Herbaspirillum sp.]|jgi:hypothetical protein